MIAQGVCGQTLDLHYDDNSDKVQLTDIDLELVKVLWNKKEISVPNGEAFYAIDFIKKNKRILRLHIKEALELKGIIDSLVYDANLDMCMKEEDMKNGSKKENNKK